MLILDRLTPEFGQSMKRAGPKIKKNKQKQDQEYQQFDLEKAAMGIQVLDDLEVNYENNPLNDL